MGKQPEKLPESWEQNPNWPTNIKKKRVGKAPDPDHHHDLRIAQSGESDHYLKVDYSD
jgi:hypothetical protein